MEPRRRKKIVVGVILFLLWAPIFLVVRHSVEEIHYMKTLYPPALTLNEAFWAVLIELIKVSLIALPLLIAMILVWKVSRD
jgi:hypothetical protein